MNETYDVVNELIHLIDYQEGSIVSKELIGRKAGNVTLFAFDAGQGLSEHTAPFDAFVHVVDGRAEITIAGKPYAVSSGSCMTMPANIPHSVRADERFKMVLVLLKD
jgi:quercetin dioxygenase-like cupin family protein